MWMSGYMMESLTQAVDVSTRRRARAGRPAARIARHGTRSTLDGVARTGTRVPPRRRRARSCRRRRAPRRHGGRLDAERGQRRDAVLRDAARDDEPEAREVGRDVEREAVHRDPARDAHADRADLRGTRCAARLARVAAPERPGSPRPPRRRRASGPPRGSSRRPPARARGRSSRARDRERSGERRSDRASDRRWDTRRAARGRGR